MLGFLPLTLLASIAAAFPGMDLGFRETAVFVPGQDVIHVQPSGTGVGSFILRSSAPAGVEGVAEVTPSDAPAGAPPLFYIAPGTGQLMLFVNATTLLHVNVLNATDVASHPAFAKYDGDGERVQPTPLQAPLQIAFARKPAGLKHGVWSWLGTLLTYELPASAARPLGAPGSQSNQGVFFQCLDKAGRNGLYTSLDPSFTPPGCAVVTLHSYAAAQTQDRARRREL